MAKIKCPHCGYWQEPYRHVILCEKCYTNIKEVVDEHFRGRVEEEPPKELKGDILKWAWKAFNKRSGGDRSGLSGPLVIFERTFETSIRRFPTLYPLVFVSFLFFVLTGVFISKIGSHLAYNMLEVRPPDDLSNVNASIAGIVACLFLSFYGQAAFVFAVSNEGFGVRSALAKAWRRLGSYVVLVLLMAILIGTGLMLFLVPAVIAGVFLVFTPFVFAAEDAGLIGSFSRSIRYASSSWLLVFFRLAPVSFAVILMCCFFAYGGGGLLWATENAYAFIFVISALLSLPILFLAVFISKIYEDVRRVEGFLPAVEVISPASPKIKTAPVSTGLSSFEELLRSSWGLYQRRFIPLSILNIISCLPHGIHILILLAGYFGLKTFFDAFGIKGDYGLLPFLVLSVDILALLIVGMLVYGILYALSAVSGLMLYLLLELAYVYVIADETIGVREAMRKAWKRVGGYSWIALYRNFVVSTGGALFVPGVIFWVWHGFTPYVFALEGEEQTPLTSLLKGREYVRGLWAPLFKQLMSLRLLPLVVVSIFFFFVLAGLPFYWIFGLFLSFFTGFHLPGMLTVYSSFFWVVMSLSFLILAGGFYLPFQKAFLYLLYRELKDLKTDDSSMS